MPLKVRFRHAAAQRVLDLPDRGMAKPLIIGRGTDVDLRLPIETVAPQHAALFVKDGAWIIQGMTGVVTLGGKTIKGATKLRSGDIVGLGEGEAAPTLEIDPKVAVSEPSAVGSGSESKPIRPQRPPAPAPAPAPVPARARPAQPEAEPVAAPPAAQIAEQYAGVENDDAIEWDPQTPVPDTTQFYVPKPKTPVIPIIIAVVLGGGALVAVGIYAYQRTRHPTVVVLRPDGTPAPVSTSTSTKRPLFDLNANQPTSTPTTGSQDQTPPPAGSNLSAAAGGTTTLTNSPPAAKPVAAINHPAAAPVGPAVKEEAPPDPNDTEWAEIRSAHFNVRHQGVAIIKYDEYRRDHPGKFTALLDRYTDEAVNWLYWQRVAQLWARQDDLVAQIRQKKRDIQNQPPGDFHERLVKELADLQTKDEETKKLLTDEMGYRGDVPPDLESPRQLKSLEDSRDPAKYAAFTKHVLRYVRNNHGGVWWDGE